MPKRAYMFIFIEPIQETPACDEVLCVSTYVVPNEDNPSGGHLARASGRGRAHVTFTVPPTAKAFIPTPSGKLRKEPQSIAWRDAQAVRIVAAGAKQNRRGDQIVGVAVSKTVVQLQPTPVP
jgi:hypothetical protein